MRGQVNCETTITNFNIANIFIKTSKILSSLLSSLKRRYLKLNYLLRSHLEVGASFLRAESSLVGAVPAVVLRVTLPGVGHAAAVVALELRGAARHVDAARLVGEVAAVVLGVALESRRDATTRFAHEF